MIFRDRDTGAYPISERELIARDPTMTVIDWTQDEFDHFKVDPVYDSPSLPSLPLKVVREGDPVYNEQDGHWYRSYSYCDIWDTMSDDQLHDYLLTLINDRKDMVRAIRYRYETNGFMYNGFPVRTDATSQSKLMMAVALLKESAELADLINANSNLKTLYPTYQPLTSIDWEGMPDIWKTLDLTTLRFLAVEVGIYVQRCFSYSKTLIQQLDEASLLSDTITVKDALQKIISIDINSGWDQLM